MSEEDDCRDAGQMTFFFEGYLLRGVLAAKVVSVVGGGRFVFGGKLNWELRAVGGPRAKFSWMPLRKLFAGGPDAPGPGCLIMGVGAADIVTDVEWIVGANIDTEGKLSGAAATGGATGSEPLMFSSQFVVWVWASNVKKPYLFDIVFSGVPFLMN